MFNLSLSFAVAICLLGPCISNAATEEWHKRPSDEEIFTAKDVAAEAEFGRELVAKILGKYPASDNPAVVRYISLVGHTLVANTNRPELTYHFMILDTEELNSFAAPGGYVFISKGLLKFLADESELAAVLAHEIAHILERHLIRELKIKGAHDPSSMALLVGGVTGVARTAFVQATDEIARKADEKKDITYATYDEKVERGFELLLTNKYSLKDEMQADKDAVGISALSGYDPAGFVSYLKRIETIKEKSPAASAYQHQSVGDRISILNAVIAAECAENCGFANRKNRFSDAMKILERN